MHAGQRLRVPHPVQDRFQLPGPPVREDLRCNPPRLLTFDGGCDDPATSCQKGYCNFNYCVEDYLGFPIGDAGNYGGPCNYATDAGDGLCVPGLAFQPFMNPMGTATNPYGSCEPAEKHRQGGRHVGIHPSAGLVLAASTTG